MKILSQFWRCYNSCGIISLHAWRGTGLTNSTNHKICFHTKKKIIKVTLNSITSHSPLIQPLTLLQSMPLRVAMVVSSRWCTGDVCVVATLAAPRSQACSGTSDTDLASSSKDQSWSPNSESLMARMASQFAALRSMSFSNASSWRSRKNKFRGSHSHVPLLSGPSVCCCSLCERYKSLESPSSPLLWWLWMSMWSCVSQAGLVWLELRKEGSPLGSHRDVESI